MTNCDTKCVYLCQQPDGNGACGKQLSINNSNQIETTDVDVEAVAWAIATLDAFHVGYMTNENEQMMDRLRSMTGR